MKRLLLLILTGFLTLSACTKTVVVQHDPFPQFPTY